jgi:uncharacterized protein (TIGR02145 family)
MSYSVKILTCKFFLFVFFFLVTTACKKAVVPVLTTYEVREITTTTAICGGFITDNGGADVTSRGVCWSTGQNPTISGNKTTDGTGISSFISSISDLTPNTNYYLRAYASNRAGTGYGNEISFTTEPVTPLQVLTTNVQLSFDEYGSGGAYTGGTIVSDGGMIITSRGVCWSTNQSPTILDKKTSDGTGSGAFKSLISRSNLGPATTYYVRAYATNGSGTAYGNQVSFTSPCIILDRMTYYNFNLSAPSNDAIGQSTSTKLAWIKAGYAGKVDVYLSTSPNPSVKIASNYLYDTLTVSGLAAGITYYWKVFRFNSSLPCDTATTSVWHFTTFLKEKTPSVSTLPVTSYTSVSAIVGGKVVDNGGAAVSEYGVYWGTKGNPESTGTKVPVGTGTGAFSTGLAGLIQSTTYYVKAYATNSIGTAYGTQVIFDLNNGSISVTDIDGNVYNTVKIGNQLWMAENLKTTKYSDGTVIPLVQTSSEWAGLDETSKAYCWYADNILNKDIYGALYTWGAAMNGALSNNNKPSGVQGACPVGWHLPSDAEWIELENYLGGMSLAGNKMKETGISHWAFPNPGATNESGFSALPGGFRGFALYYNGGCSDISTQGGWWSTYGPVNQSYIVCRLLSVGSPYILNNGNYKNYGRSVRCIKD